MGTSTGTGTTVGERGDWETTTDSFSPRDSFDSVGISAVFSIAQHSSID